jgi:Tol biopolymer transport system component
MTRRRVTSLTLTLLVGAVAGTGTAASTSNALSLYRTGIYSVRDDGRDRREIAVPDPPVDFLIRSPGGRQILFTREVDRVPALFVAERSGANAVRLTPADLRATLVGAAFSPDGRTIAFSTYTSCDYRCLHYMLWLVERDGSGLRLVADHGRYPSWSPDGRRLAYAANGIYVTDSELGERYLVSRGYAYRPVWAPRGGRIAYSATMDGYGVACFVNADGSRRRCTHGRSLSAPVWSRDSRRVAFKQQTRPQQLVIMDSDARHLRYLGNHRRSATPVAWSPDGTRLVFSFGGYGGQFFDQVKVLRLDAPGRSQTVFDERGTYLRDIRWRGRRISFVASRAD